MPGGVSKPLPPLVSQHRPLRHTNEPPPAGLFLSGGGSPRPGHQRDEPVLGQLPFGFIPNVLSKVRQSRNLEVTLVALYWPLKPWFPDILELLVDITVLLPRRRDLLRQPHFHHFLRNLPAFHMTGFRIASECLVILACLWRWLDNLPSAASFPPT